MRSPSPVITFGALFFTGILGFALLVPVSLSGAFLIDDGVTSEDNLHGGIVDLKLTETGPTNGQGSTTDETKADVTQDTWDDTTHGVLDTVSNTLTVDNTASTIGTNRVNITVTFAENDSDSNNGNVQETARTIEVTAFEYNGSDLTGSELTDQNSNSRLDVEDLTYGSNAQNLSSQSGMAVNESTDLTIQLSGSADILTGVKSGDGIDITVTIQVSTSSFTESDRSVDNTIRYG